MRPLPIQQPHPSFLHGGGVTLGHVRAARRTARHWAVPVESLNHPGVPRGMRKSSGGRSARSHKNACWIHVSEDPTGLRAHSRAGPHRGSRREGVCGAHRSARAQSGSPFQNVDSLEALKAVGIYRVLTPDEWHVALAKEGAKSRATTTALRR